MVARPKKITFAEMRAAGAAVCSSTARPSTAAVIGDASAPTSGLTKSGYPISSLGSCARRVAVAAPTSSQTGRPSSNRHCHPRPTSHTLRTTPSQSCRRAPLRRRRDIKSHTPYPAPKPTPKITNIVSTIAVIGRQHAACRAPLGFLQVVVTVNAKAVAVLRECQMLENCDWDVQSASTELLTNIRALIVFTFARFRA